MKIHSIVILGLALALTSLAPRAKAADTPDCDKIDQACGEAGFTRGLPEGQGRDLVKGCGQPILKGQTVSGVTVDPNTVKQCLAEQKGTKKKKRRH